MFAFEMRDIQQRQSSRKRWGYSRKTCVTGRAKCMER